MAIDHAAPRRRVRGHHVVLLVTVAALIVAVRLKWFSGASEAAPVTAAIPQPVLNLSTDEEPDAFPPSSPEESLSPEEQLQQKLLGSWRDKFYGERTMTFHSDGTGIMVIKLDTAGRLLYGDKLKIDLAWSITDGVLEMHFTGGEPKWAMSTITSGWGARHEQKIEQLDEADLHLRSTDSGNLYKLQRVEEPAAQSAAP